MTYACEILGRFVSDLSFNDLPPSVVAKAKQCLIDAIGCLAGADQTPAGTIIERSRQAMGTTTGNSVHSQTNELDPASRAADYALLINALDYDDIFWKGHPGATVNAAVLALAPVIRPSGRSLIEAIVVGYEVSCRVGMSLGHSAPRKTIHGHGTWQTFGAAAAAAKLLGLNGVQAAHAISIAAANAPVPSVMKTVYGRRPTMVKNNFASAAHAGVIASYRAQAGMDGPLDVFEGDTGFWQMAGADEVDIARLTCNLGDHFEIANVGFKTFSCCRIIQACAQAATSAFSQIAPDNIAENVELVIASVPEIACAPPFSTPRPKTMVEAQFSVPHAIIAAVLGIPPGPDWFNRKALERSANHRLVDKILLKPRRPTAYHGADISVMLSDDRTTSSSVQIPTGDAASPVSDSFLAQKFMRLSEPKLGKKNASEILKIIANLEEDSCAEALTLALKTLN